MRSVCSSKLPVEGLLRVHLEAGPCGQDPVPGVGARLTVVERPLDVHLDEALLCDRTILGLPSVRCTNLPTAPLRDILEVVLGDLDSVDGEGLADVLGGLNLHDLKFLAFWGSCAWGRAPQRWNQP
jgi:hypothetical protein